MASDICAPRGPAESPQRARNLHSGQLASLDKLCVRRKGAVKKHCCFSVPKSPGPLHFQSGCPYTRGCTSSNPEPRPAELTRSARLSEGTRSQRRRLPARRVAAMQRWQGLPEEAPLGGQYLSLGRKGRCRLGRPRRRPAPSEVGSEGSVGSTGVAPARDPGRAGAQAAHRRPGLCSPRPAGGAASPLGVPLKAAARRCATPRGALFAHTGILAAAAPLADCSLSLLLPLARPPAGSLQPPGLPGGVGGSSPLGLHAPAAARAPRRVCTGPRRLQRAAARMHRPLLLLLRAPGVGGGEAGERWQPRRRQRAAEAQMQPRGPRRRKITGPGGAGRTRGRPGGQCTGRASSRGVVGTARAGLSRAHGPAQRARAPGASASRRLVRAGTSPSLRPGRLAPRPAGGGPALCFPRLASAASSHSRRPGCLARCSAPARLTGTSAGSRRGVLLPARSAVQPNQRRPRGGYQGDAAPRPAGGVVRCRHARFSRQNSKAGRAALQPPPPSWGEEGPAPGGLQLPVCRAPAPGGGAPTGDVRHSGTCSPFVEYQGWENQYHLLSTYLVANC